VVTEAENELITRIEGDAPLGHLMTANYWVPFAKSEHLVKDDRPIPVRLFGEDYVAFRGEDGKIGFLDEHCPHRQASLVLGRIEGNCVRCIYHGWAIDTSGTVVDVPNQATRKEAFAASVKVSHFPVHECGGIAWVWLGGGETPAFPELPFEDEDLHRFWVVSRVPCNWLQGLEGTIDSVHAGMLHRTWIELAATLAEHSNMSFALESPTYETEFTSYGMRAAALRATSDGRTYVRITEHLSPFVTVIPVGATLERTGSVFLVTPVDDTHHLLFFGTFGDSPHSGVPLHQIAMQAADYVPEDDHDFSGLRGDRSNAWGQDRELMASGHFTGIGRSLLEEDAVVQTSMGPIVDRSKETLSSSDVAVAQNRRLLLDAISAVEAGELPPGSARSAEPVRVPNGIELLVDEGQSWRDMAFEPASS
jgi:nitrite reductase/ring-hydroxylating ferredoxin subunit